jgi:cephalosporin-C deacetylase-like acetyl esterase
MSYIDLPLDELRAYRPALEPPADLAAFWVATLADARRHDLAATFTPVATGLTLIDTFDVTFAGFGGDPIRAWLRLPAGATRPLPAVVQFVGYGASRTRTFCGRRPGTPTWSWTPGDRGPAGARAARLTGIRAETPGPTVS